MKVKDKNADVYYERVSNWIALKEKPVTKRHHLYDYAIRSDGILTYFVYAGREYALGQFIRLTYFKSQSIELETGVILSGYNEDYMNPLLIEVNDAEEKIRLWKVSYEED